MPLIHNPDVTIMDCGSICLVSPHTAAASEWIDENVDEAATWHGKALAVEPRYLDALVEGMRDDDLVVA